MKILALLISLPLFANAAELEVKNDECLKVANKVLKENAFGDDFYHQNAGRVVSKECPQSYSEIKVPTAKFTHRCRFWSKPPSDTALDKFQREHAEFIFAEGKLRRLKRLDEEFGDDMTHKLIKASYGMTFSDQASLKQAIETQQRLHEEYLKKYKAEHDRLKGDRSVLEANAIRQLPNELQMLIGDGQVQVIAIPGRLRIEMDQKCNITEYYRVLGEESIMLDQKCFRYMSKLSEEGKRACRENFQWVNQEKAGIRSRPASLPATK